MMTSQNNIKVIAISGLARAGKDTFVSIAKNILVKNGYTGIRVAFADALKEEVQQMLSDNKFSLDIAHITPEEKEQVRPLFVFWGCQRRLESHDGLYWVKKAEDKIKFCYESTGSPYSNLDRNKMVFLVSDVRFPNEARWVHEKFDGDVIHLRKYSVHTSESPAIVYGVSSNVEFHRVYDDPPNEEERKQDPLVREIADQRIDWEKSSSGDVLTDSNLNNIVINALNNTKYFKHTSNGILS